MEKKRDRYRSIWKGKGLIIGRRKLGRGRILQHSALGKEKQQYFEAEKIGEKEIRLQCMLTDKKFIIATRPHMFTDWIYDPTHIFMEKARKKNSKVKQPNFNELHYQKVTCFRTSKFKTVEKDFIYIYNLVKLELNFIHICIFIKLNLRDINE